MSEPTSILLIDVSHLFWSNWHATKDQSISEAYELTVAKVAQLREGYQFVAVCCDCPPYKRKEEFPGYKMNREAAPPAAVAQFERVKQRLEADGMLLWGVKGFEADDIIASATKRARQLDEPAHVTIASNDKDLLQLVRDPSDEDAGVSYLSTASGATLTEQGVVEKFGVPPSQMGDLLAMMGDKSDNIEGVPGIGKVRAAALLKEYGNLEGILAGIVEAKPSAVRESLMASGKIVRLARRLVTLDDSVPLNFDEIFERREAKPLVETNMADLGAEDPTDPEDVISPPVAAAQPPPVVPDLPKPPAPVQAIERRPQHEKPDALALQLPYELQLQPRSLIAASALGAAIHNSRLFPKFGNAEAITAVILRGREMGISALTSCQVFHYFSGQLVMHAHLIVAKVEEHPDCEYFLFVGGDDTYAEYACKNRHHKSEVRLKYTIEQAKQAGLCPDEIRTRNPKPGEKDERGAWEKRPAELLRKTCAVQLGRIAFPAAALGLLSVEELGADL